MFQKKGQGATEYLVLLAVVLIIAMVAIALLGFFPGLSVDAKMQQSDAYWAGEARPFSILEHSISPTGAVNIVLENVDASGTFTMRNVTIGNYTYATATTFAPGESKRITAAIGGPTGTAGTIYDVGVNISYSTPNGISKTQYGAKNLVGKYSS